VKTIKAFCLMAMALALSPAMAHAKMIVWNRSGPWVNSAGTLNDGQLGCAMGIADVGREVYVKYFHNTGDVSVQVFKNSWRIPAGTKLQLELGFDKGSWASGTASGYVLSRDRSSYVEIGILHDKVADFSDNFKEANHMWLRFPDGDETDWIVRMDGSRNAARAFEFCIGKLASVPKPTQPFGGRPSQPFGSKKLTGEESF
jgi:hypothetical protein